jgi:formylglycine-generating enzyme required for sulfatase activity
MLLGWIGLGCSVSFATVSVSNLVVAQREGTKLVELSYDVACNTSNEVTVSLAVSNGTTVVYAPSVSGDVGEGVAVGTHKTMVWDMATDWNRQVSTAMNFKVMVSDEPAPPPAGMVQIPAGINRGTDPDYGAYALTNEVAFYMDPYEVTNDKMVEVLQWAYDQGKLVVSSSSVKNAEGNRQELLSLDDSGCRIIWDGSTFGMKSLKGSGYPCVEVSWYGSVAYCNYRSEMEGRALCYNLSDWSCDLSAHGYRLPTSDEWEYAARGGLSGRRFPWGDTITHAQANYYSKDSYTYDISSTRGLHPDYDDGGHPYTSPVGSFPANGYGLYDMAGNVWEWCNTKSGSGRVLRGGQWGGYASYLRCGYEWWYYPANSYDYNGFRAVSY